MNAPSNGSGFGRHEYAPLLGKRIQPRLYRIWTDMKGRCTNPNMRSFADYGARGIRVCAEWQGYDAFRAWAISTGYTKEGTIDRLDCNGNYEPSNCRWLPHGQQQWNTRATRHLTFGGVTKPLPAWAHEHGINPEIYRQRRRQGWTDEEILTVPIGATRPGVKRGRPRVGA